MYLSKDTTMNSKRGAAGRQRMTGLKRSEALSVRLDDQTKTKLEAAAEKNKSTVSSEAAERLAQSFASSERGLKPDFDLEEDRGLAHLLVMLHRRVRQYTAYSWRDHPRAFKEFADGVAIALQALPRMLGFLGREFPEPERLAEIYRNSPRALLGDAATVPAPGELGRAFMVDLLEALPDYVQPGVHHKTGFVSEYRELAQAAHDLRLGGTK
jgi:hypothetical protein